MISCISRPRTSPHPLTGDFYEWAVVVDGDEIPWQSYAGPLRFDETDFAIATRKLLSIEPDELPELVGEHVEFSSPSEQQPRLMVHSTTPYASSFETDLTAMVEGRPVLDLTTYVETRGLYLARSGDLVVGRTQPWRRGAAASGVERLVLPDADYYYMSQALLRRAVDGGDRDPVMRQIIEFLRENPSTVVCPYDFEPEFQLFVTWLARITGLGRIRVDANDSRLGVWNRKRMLHPTVEAALSLESQVAGQPGPVVLEHEHRASEAFKALQVPIPVLPGYAVTWQVDRGDFVRDLLRAGALLQDRYGLSRACLKPSDGGNGGRIVPNIELDDTRRLEELATAAWKLGGDQVLEAHVTYFEREVGGERVLDHAVSPRALGHATGRSHSAVHARHVVEGQHLCQRRGLGEPGSGREPLHRAAKHDDRAPSTTGFAALRYRLRHRHRGRRLRRHRRGRRAGHQSESHRALFLREFMARHPEIGVGAATRVLSPEATESAENIRSLVSEFCTAEQPCEEVAVVPGRWAMIATAGPTSVSAGAQALTLERMLATSR